jgi:hypothetical protein
MFRIASQHSADSFGASGKIADVYKKLATVSKPITPSKVAPAIASLPICFPQFLWLAHRHSSDACRPHYNQTTNNLTRLERFNKVKALQVLLWTIDHLIKDFSCLE